MACEGKKKATITLVFADGAKEKIISDNPPVQVTTKQITASSLKKIYVVGTAYNSSCQALPGYEEYRGEVPLNTQVHLVQSSGGICPNGVQYHVANAGGSTGTEWVNGSTSIKEIYIPTSGCQFKIDDATGIIYNKLLENQACPTYNISCDDNCPPGHMKCCSSSYPGYCCIPCSEIKGGIQGATAYLRGLNRG